MKDLRPVSKTLLRRILPVSKNKQMRDCNQKKEIMNETQESGADAVGCWFGI